MTTLEELTETDRMAIQHRVRARYGKEARCELVAFTPVLWSGWEMDRAVALISVADGQHDLFVLDGVRGVVNQSVEAMLEERLAEYERVTQLTRDTSGVGF